MELLKDLYRISSPSGEESAMTEFVVKKLQEAGAECRVDESGNVYAVKGEADTYPCIVSHLDEVHRAHEPGHSVLTLDDYLIFGYNVSSKETEGIGADDKNGIWVCLRAMQEYDVMKCAFFVGEEVGCVGSSKADMAFFDNVRYVLQCDRRGGHDFIIDAAGVELCSDEFIQAVGMEEFCYHEEFGCVTDVMTLKQNGLKVSACNLSCGYYNPHTDSEATDFNDLSRCLDFVRHIIETCTDVYPHEHKPKVKKNSFLTGWDDWKLSNDRYSYRYDDEYIEAYAEMEQLFLKGELSTETELDSYIEIAQEKFLFLTSTDYDCIWEELKDYHDDISYE